MKKKKNKDTIVVVPPTPAVPIRLDLGCGPHKREGFFGVDAIKFPGVDLVADLKQPWPWANDSVDEVHSSHFIEHFTGIERCHIYNELFRVLKVEAKATLITPHWASGRAYGDPTHQWPPISGFSFMYLLKEWRMQNAPHTDASNWPLGYKCNFSASWGFSIHPQIQVRNQEFQQFAINFYIEAAQDVIVTLAKLDHRKATAEIGNPVPPSR